MCTEKGLGLELQSSQRSLLVASASKLCMMRTSTLRNLCTCSAVWIILPERVSLWTTFRSINPLSSETASTRTCSDQSARAETITQKRPVFAGYRSEHARKRRRASRAAFHNWQRHAPGTEASPRVRQGLTRRHAFHEHNGTSDYGLMSSLRSAHQGSMQTPCKKETMHRS